MPPKHPLPPIEHDIAERLRKFRESLGMSRAEMAKALDITPERWASYEEARAPLRWEMFLRLAQRFLVNPRWLARGDSHEFSVYDPLILDLPIGPKALLSSAFAEHLEKHMPRPDVACAFQPYRTRINAEELTEQLRRLADSTRQKQLEALRNPRLIGGLSLVQSLSSFWLREAEKDGIRIPFSKSAPGAFLEKEMETLSLTTSTNDEYMSLMPNQVPELNQLLSRVRKAAAKPGKRTELANRLNVKLSQVSEWLSEKKTTRKPSGEYTLQMLRWVAEQE